MIPYLMINSPLSNISVVLALMLRVEIRKCFWAVGKSPDLTKHSSVCITHENLTDGIETVTDVVFHDLVVIQKSMGSELLVIIEVVV